MRLSKYLLKNAIPDIEILEIKWRQYKWLLFKVISLALIFSCSEIRDKNMSPSIKDAINKNSSKSLQYPQAKKIGLIGNAIPSSDINKTIKNFSISDHILWPTFRNIFKWKRYIVAAILFYSAKGDLACVTNTVDNSTSNAGLHTSLQLNNLSNPVISYYDNSTNRDLKLAVCGNFDCSIVDSINVVDSVRNVGEFNSLQLNSAGHPVISYFDRTNTDLKLAVCGNPSCSIVNPTMVVDPTEVGLFTSLQLNNLGNPVISYYDSPNGVLKLAVCGSFDCSIVEASNIVDSIPVVGQYTSLQLNNLGNPVISHYDDSNGDLKLAICRNASCSIVGSTNKVDSVGNVGQYTSLQLNNLGNPVISYYDISNSSLKLAVCSNPNCSITSINIVDSVGNVGQYTSLQLNNLGNPVISYYDISNSSLKLAVCSNPNCSIIDCITIVDSMGDVGQYTSLQLNNLGNPVISYYDVTNGNLKLAVCSPTPSPTPSPTNSPTFVPTDPTLSPTNDPTVIPTFLPTTIPTTIPTTNPTTNPTTIPTTNPTTIPTTNPTTNPTLAPTGPTNNPTTSPTLLPTNNPTSNPTLLPTNNPTSNPTLSSTNNPTSNPTLSPTKSPILSKDMEDDGEWAPWTIAIVAVGIPLGACILLLCCCLWIMNRSVRNYRNLPDTERELTKTIV